MVKIFFENNQESYYEELIEILSVLFNKIFEKHKIKLNMNSLEGLENLMNV